MILLRFLIWGTSLAILVLSQRNSNHDLRRIWVKISSFEFRWESTKTMKEVRHIKNPKSIMVKPNYKNIIKIIGQETSSDARMLKSYRIVSSHHTNPRTDTQFYSVWIGFQHSRCWACFGPDHLYYIFIIWFNYDTFWILNLANSTHHFGTFPAKLKWWNLDSNTAQVVIWVPLGKYQNGEWGSQN